MTKENFDYSQFTVGNTDFLKLLGFGYAHPPAA
jgi:hypothetical protein